MKTIKSIFILILFGLLVFGCLKVEKPECRIKKIDGNPESVIGTWQLVSKEYINQELGVTELTDYSCYGIYYTFFANGEFQVSGSHPEMPNYASYTYDFKYGEVKDNQPGNSTLTLSNPSYPCILKSNQMTIDRMYLDGSKFIFYRVKDLVNK